jgi:hypothetical protein
LILVGYHGCDQTIRDGLVNRSISHLNTSNNRYDWLGAGAYFFVGDYERAMHFANYAFENPHLNTTAKPILSPAVVGAVIEVDSIWDLSRTSGKTFFSQTRQRLEQDFASAGKAVPINKRKNSDDDLGILRYQDRAVIEIGCEITASNGRPYDAVQGIFQQGKPLGDLSGFYQLSHTQIAVRSPAKSIIGYFVPT